jgi:hypothetical protein
MLHPSTTLRVRKSFFQAGAYTLKTKLIKKTKFFLKAWFYNMLRIEGWLVQATLRPFYPAVFKSQLRYKLK